MSKKPQRLPPTPSVIKKLFAYSGNQCAMPNCTETLVDVSGTMLGKIAHICAAEKGGARYDPNMTDEERRDISNLFIVCGKHHDIIDDKNNERDYPAGLLRKYKTTHEGRFKKAERQLLKQFADTTQIAKPTYPKHLRALAKVLGVKNLAGHTEEIRGVRDFIDSLKELPLQERDFALVRLARPLWITKARDGTEVEVGGSGGLAILLKPRSVRPYARCLFFCYRSEEGLSVLRLIRLQQVERLLQPLVSLCRSLLSIRDGIAERFRRTGRCLRTADPKQALNNFGLELLVSCLFTSQPLPLTGPLHRDLPLVFPNQESRHQRKHGKDGNDCCHHL
jgi:hypothetical protein